MTFTDKKPTVPGAYWWRRTEKHPSLLVTVHFCDSVRCSDLECLGITDMRGIWSSRLVPVEEVELAYHEGVENKRNQFLSDHPRDWENSRARRVVEGKDGV